LRVEKQNYKDIHSQVRYIKKIFEDENIQINEQSFLYKLLANVLNNYKEEPDRYSVIFDALHIYRIHTALVNLEGFENKNRYLIDLLKGTLDFMDVEQSHAKNILFELEVAGTLRKKFKHTFLNEPDIVVSFDDGNVAVACKKVVSKQNLQKQLSKAVKQIKNNEFLFGIVAINIDNALPRKTILNAKTRYESMELLDSEVVKFFNEHDRHFKKYLDSGRVMGILLVASTIVDIEDEKPRFLNISQSLLFVSANLEEEYFDKINKFKVLEDL